ncbi:hypothetical protein J6590_068089, partial [Homalodisca vitripennis]
MVVRESLFRQMLESVTADGKGGSMVTSHQMTTGLHQTFTSYAQARQSLHDFRGRERDNLGSRVTTSSALDLPVFDA